MSEQDRKVGPYLGPRKFIEVTEGEKVLEQRDADALRVTPTMPTPLYVTAGGRKQVVLGFKTQEEADFAQRYLDKMAGENADRRQLEVQAEADEARAKNQPLLTPDGLHKWNCPCAECEKL